jgi:hypothetical protein
MSKQTAVEWLKKQLDFLEDDMTAHDINWLFGKAEAMEKEQIKTAWCDGNDSEPKEVTGDYAEQYYNETYGGNK